MFITFWAFDHITKEMVLEGSDLRFEVFFERGPSHRSLKHTWLNYYFDHGKQLHLGLELRLRVQICTVFSEAGKAGYLCV